MMQVHECECVATAEPASPARVMPATRARAGAASRMARLVLGMGLGLACIAAAAPAKKETGPALIQRAKEDFLRGQYARALDLLDQFASREDVTSPADATLGWELTARCCVATHEAANASKAFQSLLRWSENWRPEASTLKPFSDAETEAFETALEERRQVDTIALPDSASDSTSVEEAAPRAPAPRPVTPAPPPRPEQALVIVTTVPRGVHLTVSSGGQSPFSRTFTSDTFFTVPAPRALRIIAEKPGYVFHDSSFSVSPGDTTLIQLEPGWPDPAATATLDLSSDAPMNVFVDGAHKGSTAADTATFHVTLPPGAHFVHVASDYGISCDWPLSLEPGEERPLRANFLGQIRVVTSEQVEGGEATIESPRLKNKLTVPAGSTSGGLWPGTYTVRFHCKNCRSRSRDDLVREVVVTSGKVIDCNFDVFKQH